MISISFIQRTLILGLCVIPQISLGAVDLTGGIWISRERKVDEATPSSVAGVENPVETNIHTFVTPLYVVMSNFGLGAKMIYERSSSEIPDLINETTTFKAIGPTIGYGSGAMSGLTTSATLLIGPTKTFESRQFGMVTLSADTGLSLDLGYRLKLGEAAVGPIVSYTQVKYKTVGLGSDDTDSLLRGYLGLWYQM